MSLASESSDPDPSGIRPPQAEIGGTVRRIVILAVVNTIAGWAGLLLAVPPGFASAAFPPSGMALGLLIVWGRRHWPGVWLGSFAFNLLISRHLLNGDGAASVILTAGLIAIGSTGQAVIGTWAVRRFLPGPLRLDRERSIGLFLLIGAASCLIAPTVGVGSLLLSGTLSQELLSNWFTWYVGDTLGVFVFAPVVFILLAEPRKIWRNRIVPVGGSLLIAFAVSMLLFHDILSRETETNRLRFERRAITMHSSLERTMAAQEEILQNLVALFETQQEITREEFDQYATRIVNDHPELLALEYLPEVPADRWDEFIERVRSEADQQSDPNRRRLFAEFTFQRFDGQTWSRVETADGTTAYPVYYLVPLAGNERAFGLDLGSQPDRLAAIKRAGWTGKMTATKTVALAQSDRPTGVLIFHPIAGTGDFVLGVFRIDRMMKTAFAPFDLDGLRVRIREGADAELGSGWLYDSSGGAIGSEVEPITIPLAIGGREWVLHYLPEGIEGVSTQWQPWAVLVGSLLFTSLLGAGLLLITGRTDRVEETVIERTVELTKANRNLADEIQLREDVQEQLRERAEELARSFGELDEFTHAASHDLRSPLRAITHLTNWIIEDEGTTLSEESQSYVEMLRVRLDRMDRLITGLLEYSRAGSRNYPVETIELRSMLEAVTDLLDRPTDFRFEIECSIGESPIDSLRLRTQRVPLEQVVRNLIDNAIKHHDRSDGVVTVSARRLESSDSVRNGVEFEIRDNGPGIDPSFHERIFKAFEKLESQDEVEGSGLGLAFVKKAVERHGGWVTVQSALGEGTTFRFFWPETEDGLAE